MTAHPPQAQRRAHNLVKGLIGALTRDGPSAGARSLGLVGATLAPPHPPLHCLRACLHGDPRRLFTDGCDWLRRLAAGAPDAGGLRDGRCARGFRVAARPVGRNREPVFLVSAEGEGDGHPPADTGSQVLDRLESLSRIFEQVGQLLDENEGLADEVLRSYEQLNLIFDFTQQIASLTDAEEIEKVLLHRLGRLLSASTVVTVGAGGQTRCFDFIGDELRDAALEPDRVPVAALGAELDACRTLRAVSVHAAPAARIMVCPLVRLDNRVDVLLAARPLAAGEFTSGDMLMIESLLTFGGQIISNAEIHERLRRMSLEATRALVAAIDKKDHYTSGHSERVGVLARLTGQRMGVPADQLQILEMSGLLHDVGKIGVPEEILCKPGRLTRAEYDIIKSHPRMGYEILKPIGSFGAVLDGVLYHHEAPDGSGYPEGLRGDAIPLYARIIHVADVFDALTSTRSYRAAYSFEQACEILHQEAGTRLDAQVVNVFLQVLATFRHEHPREFDALFAAEREVVNASA